MYNNAKDVKTAIDTTLRVSAPLRPCVKLENNNAKTRKTRWRKEQKSPCVFHWNFRLCRARRTLWQDRIERPFERPVELDVAYKRENLKSASGLIGFIIVSATISSSALDYHNQRVLIRTTSPQNQPHARSNLRRTSCRRARAPQQASGCNVSPSIKLRTGFLRGSG